MVESRASDEKVKQECWKVMSFSEKVLLVVLLYVILVLIAAVVFIGYLLLNKPNICDSPTCIKASANFFEMVDVSSDPCVDFYKFTCGRYAGIDVPLQENCGERRQPRKALLHIPIDDADGETINTAKRFYQACINVDEKLNRKVLRHLIQNIGNWPLTIGNKWKQNKFHWLNFIAEKLRPRGIPSDWYLSFDYYRDNDGTNILLIGQPEHGSNFIQHKSHPESIASAAQILFGDYVSEDLQKVTDFEEKLESINSIAWKSKTTTKITVKELNKLWPDIRLVQILNNLTNGTAVFYDFTNVTIHGNYVYELNLLLTNTDARTQVNYLIWKIIEFYLPFLYETFRKAHYEKYSEYSELQDREDYCFVETSKRFYSSIESYILNNKNDNVIRSVTSMIKRIIKATDENSDDPTVVIFGLNGENSGVTNFRSHSSDLIHMINELHVYVEDQFYGCLHKESTSCIRESYFKPSEGPEIRFETNETMFYISSKLLKGDMYEWNSPNFINYARLGWYVGDTVVQTLHNRNILGVDLAYKAYTLAIEEGGMDGTLPSISYNIKQLFWIHSCSFYCKSESISKQFQEVIRSENFKNDFRCT